MRYSQFDLLVANLWVIGGYIKGPTTFYGFIMVIAGLFFIIASAIALVREGRIDEEIRNVNMKLMLMRARHEAEKEQPKKVKR